MPGKVAAILLAAGASRRMGVCKQLLELRGKTVLAHCLEALLAGGITEVVVVVAPDGGAVAQAAAAYPVRVVRNSDPHGEMAASVCTGRNALGADASGILVALGDTPLIEARSIARLRLQHRRAPERIIVPCHGGRRGHPPLLPRRTLELLHPDGSLRNLILANRDLVYHLELPDPGILCDLDTPEDYRLITALTSQ